ncbi:hypothetical protein BYZ73_20605 [Rhodovulum viride]|uniref:DUF2513 domain-containing protein n=1 Tax=Rhodovulum viride TaxID=1231134 RepID=A0ABX9DAT4_9RHOB|nr:DUF2513 domain-containing protein [Rhodovulum viride]RAP39432.1 hypothetical protein BYZ73_20605 [Rhodovulum viride]
MTRDDDLIRALMIKIEAEPSQIHPSPMRHSASEDAIREHHHLLLLADAGFLVADEGAAWFRMTSSGHAFAGMIKDDTLWHRVRSKAAEAVPRCGPGLLFEIGTAMMRDELRDMGGGTNERGREG